jgi:hypothetical protein
MTENNLILEFDGPFGLTSDSEPFLFVQPEAKEPGIYLWAVPYFQGGYLVTYVGETNASFGQRLKDHLIQTVGGNYRICDPDSMMRGEPQILWNGLWRKGTRDKFHEYIARFEELGPVIRKLLQIEVVFVAPFRSERRLRQRLEGAIAKHIRSQPAPVSAVLPSDVRYYYRKAHETPVPVIVECHCHVLGLPQKLEV